MKRMATTTIHPTARRPALGRAFLVVWAGQLVSTVGSTLSGVGGAVWVYARTGSTTWLGVLLAVSALPSIAAAPALALVDRLDRRQVMLVADAVGVSGALVALALASAGRLEPWHLVVAGAISGLGNAFQTPAYQAVIPELVPHAAIGRANGLVQLGPAVGLVIGPALATALVATWGITAVLAVDVVTFALGIATVAVTRVGCRRPSGPDVAGVDDEVPPRRRSGWGWLRGDGRPLLVLMIATALVNLCLSFYNVALLALATSLGGTGRAGMVPAVGGIAMIVMSLVVGRLGVPARRVRGLGVALGVLATGAIVASARPVFALVVAGAAIAFAAVPLATATTATLLHERVPPDVLGQVLGFRTTVVRALDPFGALVAGVVAGHLAAPALADGVVGPGLRALVGGGPGRESALLLLIAGAGLAACAVLLARSERLSELDRSAEPVRANAV